MNKLGNTGNAVRAAECCLMRNTMLTAFSLLVALFALSLFPGTPAQSQARPPQDASTPVAIGRWMARFARGGLYLDFDGVPLIKGGLVQVFAKDYARGYYGSGSNPPAATVETLPDGGRAYLANFHHAGEATRSAPRSASKFTRKIRLRLPCAPAGTAPTPPCWSGTPRVCGPIHLSVRPMRPTAAITLSWLPARSGCARTGRSIRKAASLRPSSIWLYAIPPWATSASPGWTIRMAPLSSMAAPTNT